MSLKMPLMLSLRRFACGDLADCGWDCILLERGRSLVRETGGATGGGVWLALGGHRPRPRPRPRLGGQRRRYCPCSWRRRRRRRKKEGRRSAADAAAGGARPSVSTSFRQAARSGRRPPANIAYLRTSGAAGGSRGVKSAAPLHSAHARISGEHDLPAGRTRTRFSAASDRAGRSTRAERRSARPERGDLRRLNDVRRSWRPLNGASWTRNGAVARCGDVPGPEIDLEATWADTSWPAVPSTR